MEWFRLQLKPKEKQGVSKMYLLVRTASYDLVDIDIDLQSCGLQWKINFVSQFFTSAFCSNFFLSVLIYEMKSIYKMKSIFIMEVTVPIVQKESIFARIFDMFFISSSQFPIFPNFIFCLNFLLFLYRECNKATANEGILSIISFLKLNGSCTLVAVEYFFSFHNLKFYIQRTQREAKRE